MRFSVFTRVAMISAALCATKAVDFRENSALALINDQLADKKMMAQLDSWVAPHDNELERSLAQTKAQGKPNDLALVEEVLTNLRAVVELIYDRNFKPNKTEHANNLYSSKEFKALFESLQKVDPAKLKVEMPDKWG